MKLSNARALRTLVAVGVIAAGSLAATSPVVATSSVHVDAVVVPPQRVVPSGSPSACADGAFNVGSQRWTTTYRWRYHAASTPDELGSTAAREAIAEAFGNITGSRNDCGLADRVSASHDLLGTTDRRPNVRRNGTCGSFDGHNTVGWGELPPGIAGVTCWWFTGNRIVEADIRFNSGPRWTTTLTGCDNELMVEAVATHEAGHVFGVRHVGEGQHGRLTMSRVLDGVCQNSESSLGRGDVLALRRLY